MRWTRKKFSSRSIVIASMSTQGTLFRQLSISNMAVGILVVLAISTATAVVEAQSLPHYCRESCGDLIVPYPFGINDKGCYLAEKFLITCNDSVHDQPPEALLMESNIPVTSISLDGGELSIMKYIARDCYDRNGTPTNYPQSTFRLLNYTVSSTKNKFFSLGCDTYGYFKGHRGQERYTTGCMSFCDSMDRLTESCSGVGCCQTFIPKGLANFTVEAGSFGNHTDVWGFNPCSYAFVAEESKFNFSNMSFKYLEKKEKLPMVLNWAIGNENNETCDEANKRGNLACKGNTTCIDVKDGSGGYHCQCLTGYQGNPYHPDGCQDIDECKIPNSCGKNSICQNLPGSRTCNCLKGYYSVSETDCSKIVSQRNQSQTLVILLCITMGVCIALLIAISLVCWGMKKRKMNKLKKKFFEQNGGLMLQQHLSSRRQSLETTTIFRAEELKKATENFHESKVLGQGGYGIVYKGTLPSNNKVVAIKKSRFGADKCNEQFINEVIVLLQINHRNVVKLLGCCLETEVPILVYEYIENGTLFEHIHNKGQGRSPLSWELRLKIATEAASALSYLHSATSTPIIHRDVKTGNILLDEKYTAKISDFGASRLIPLDQTLHTTVVQGTFGYLDPEYMHTCQLTEKSDVYSFGVVLAELVTGRQVLSFDKPENEKNLAMFFVSSMKEDMLFQILDDDIIIEGNTEALKNVANLAKRCLRIKSEERPSMKEVAMELEGQRAMEMHQWGKYDVGLEETEYLLAKESSDPYAIDISGPMCSQ